MGKKVESFPVAGVTVSSQLKECWVAINLFLNWPLLGEIRIWRTQTARVTGLSQSSQSRETL